MRQNAFLAALGRAPPVVWPADWGQRFLISVDTEESFDWGGGFHRTGHSTEAITAIPAAHARFTRAGAPLCYLIDYPVARDPRARDIFGPLIADGRSGVGAQLHPWVTPPFDEALNGANSFPGNLPETLEAAKLDALIAAIEAAVGQRPIIYRAGRYGIGPNSHALLARRGFAIDASVRAYYDYSGESGPDFSDIGAAARRCGPEGALIALPVTTVFTGALRARGAGLYRALGRIPRARGLAARTGLLARVALSPEGMPLRDALEAVRVALDEGAHVLQFAFHSPSLVPGNTPYVRDEADLARFWRWWDAVFDMLARRGVAPASPAQITAALG